MNPTALTHTTTSAPVVTLVDGQPRADSRDIAVFFARTHRSVLLAIDTAIETDPDLGLHEIMQGSYTTPSTGPQEHRRFLLSRDAFALIVMGFTGTRAFKWKRAYIAAFNAMEAEIRSRQVQPAFDPNDPASLRQVLLGYTEALMVEKAKVVELGQALTIVGERAEMAEAQVAAVAPKAEFYDSFADADGLFGLHNAARAIGAPPQGFVEWLKKGFVFYQGAELMPKATFVALDVFRVKVRTDEGKARSRTYITPRGLQYLSRAWQKHLLKTGKGRVRTLFDDAA